MRLQMRHSEAQTSRMESELRQLRSFLLSKVKPVCIASPPSSPEEEDMQVFDNVGTSSHHQVTASTSHYKQATPGVTPQHDSIDSIPPTQNSAESDRTLIVQSEGENQNGNVSNEAESSPERQKRQGSPVNPQLPESSGLQSPFKRPRREERHTPQAALSGTENGLITPVSVAETPEPYYRHRKNRATMGDAETEHLLLAAQRLARVTKSVDWRPEVSRSINDRLASTSKSASRQMQPFVFPAQPLAARQAGSAGLKSMFPQSLDRPPVPSSGDSGLITNGLRSPMKSSTASTSARATYQHLDADTGVVSSSASPPLPIGAHDDADAEDGDVEKSNLLPSFRKDNPNKRVGRPAGTPNKTKTISINQTAAVRRRARRLQYIASNGGRGRGRGRPVRDSYGSPHLGERRGGHGEGTGSVDDLLFAAHMRNLTAGDEDAFYEEDEDAEGYDDDDDLYADNGMDDVQPPAMSSRTRQGSSNRRAAEISPATPRIPPANRNGVPATPNTIDRQRSALDVLAEASASADPASKRRGIPGGVHNDSRSASPLQTRRNLADAISAHDGHQQHNAAVWTGLGMPMDMTYPQPASNVTFDYSTLPPFPQPSLPIPTIQDWSYTQQPWDQQFPQPAASTSTDMSPRPVHSSYGYAIPQQLTIAQQLSHGVDESHPLIDHDDLISGMTPAAALAKKSRSPYVKWTPEEDEKLVVSIAQHGTRWDLVAKALPSRSYHQCRQRWLRGMRCTLTLLIALCHTDTHYKIAGKALPKDMLHLQAQVDAAVEAYEQEKAGKKGNQKKDDVQEE